MKEIAKLKPLTTHFSTVNFRTHKPKKKKLKRRWEMEKYQEEAEGSGTLSMESQERGDQTREAGQGNVSRRKMEREKW